MNELENDFTIRFWGVRGSYPTPGGNAMRYGGNTACVEVVAGNQTIIFDAGTGIIPLGKSLLKNSLEQHTAIKTTLLLSHLHHDHTQGFPFFAPAFMPATHLNIIGPDFGSGGPKAALEAIMAEPLFPVHLDDLSSAMNFATLRDREILLLHAGGSASLHTAGSPIPHVEDAVSVRAMRSHAHPGGVMHYRVEYAGRSLVYATDTEGYYGGDQRLVAFASGADVLIHDAQYTQEHYSGHRPGTGITQGYGHSTVAMACDVAAQAGVGQLVLFHHAPENSDELMDAVEAQAQEWFNSSLAAYEGLEIHLVPNLAVMETVEANA